MAVLTSAQLAEMRQALANKLTSIDFDKPLFNKGVQAVEDWWETNLPSLSLAINTATAPYTFSVTIKRRLIACWLLEKFNREKGV